MERRICHALTLLTVLVFLMFIGVTYATPIVWQSNDMSDVNPGEDFWNFTFTASDYTLAAQTGLTIFFDEASYDAIDPSFSSPNSDRDVLAWSPAPGFSCNGGYDVFSNIPSPSLPDPFTVSSAWLEAGMSGTQPFYIYDIDFSTKQSGSNVPAPVPATMFLLGTGIVGLISFRRNLQTR